VFGHFEADRNPGFTLVDTDRMEFKACFVVAISIFLSVFRWNVFEGGFGALFTSVYI
jgi:hypothetical protein